MHEKQKKDMTMISFVQFGSVVPYKTIAWKAKGLEIHGRRSKETRTIDLLCDIFTKHSPMRVMLAYSIRQKYK